MAYTDFLIIAGGGITVTLSSGEKIDGCTLAGADSMWSKIREMSVLGPGRRPGD